MFRFHISQEKRLRAFHTMSDEELTERYIKRREPEIITELFNRYIHLVYAVCMKYMQNEVRASDFAMEVFEGLGEKLLRFEVKHFKSWLLTIARNVCLMDLRKKKREITVEPHDIIYLNRVEKNDEAHPNDDSQWEELVLTSLNKLKECQRKCLDMMYLQDKSYKEIASITGYSIPEVKSYIQNGKRNLKKLMEDDYEGEG